MYKMTWTLIWGVIALMARSTSAINCHECITTTHKTCDDPFVPVAPAKACPAVTTQCIKFKLKVKEPSGEETLVARGCAPAGRPDGCDTEGEKFTLPGGRQVTAKGSLCLCSGDQCNEGQNFQPKMTLLIFTVATALMNILFN